MNNTIVIVPDRDYKKTILAIISKAHMLGIEGFRPSIHVDPQHDASVRKNAHILARELRGKDSDRENYAMVLFDHHGSGRDVSRNPMSPQESEANVEKSLTSVTFGSNVACICVDPEFEQWLFSDIEELARVLRISNQEMQQFKETAEKNYPGDLYKQCQMILSMRRRAGTPVEYSDILENIDFTKWLIDSSFSKLIDTLRKWFPERNALELFS